MTEKKARKKKTTVKKPTIKKTEKTVKPLLQKRKLSLEEQSTISQIVAMWADDYTVKLISETREKILNKGEDFIPYMREHNVSEFLCTKVGSAPRCIYIR